MIFSSSNWTGKRGQVTGTRQEMLKVRETLRREFWIGSESGHRNFELPVVNIDAGKNEFR